MEAIRRGDEPALRDLAVAEPRALRYLMGRLWDPDPTARRLAARALGAGAASNPDLGVVLVRNLMWALNDESATNGVYGLPALGEIGRNDPELIAPFVGPILSYAWDDGLRPAILRALTTIASAAPRLLDPHRAEVEGLEAMISPEERPLLAELRGRMMGDDLAT